MTVDAERGAKRPRRLTTLKTRADFQRVRGGRRVASRFFLLETKTSAHRPPSQPVGVPRFGLTITKQIGSAVIRNRIRRRLKAILAEIGQDAARADHDYVIVVRDAVRDADFHDLKAALVKALGDVHAAASTGGRLPPKRRT